MSDSGRPLTSPVYLSALTLLLVNDWFLKATLHNELTGKLSDLAGLFAITWFGVVLLPRYRVLVSLGVATAFVYWKSPHSDPLIAAWNDLNLFSVGRVVDPSDYIALATIPLALVHARGARAGIHRPILRLVVATISLFAFTATSYITEYEYDRSYSFSMSTSELHQRVITLAFRSQEVSPIGILAPEELEIGVLDSLYGVVSATVRVDEAPEGARLRLIQIVTSGPPEEDEKQRLLKVFEAKIVARIEPDR